MATILVTGGCGFIGSHFIKKICEARPECRIVNADARTYAARPPMYESKPENLIEEMIDIRDQAAVARLFSKHKPYKVYHFAAESHVCRSISGPKDFITTNISGTFNLLEEFRANGGDNGLFVHISTDEVFGEITTQGQFFDEGSPLNPRSPYAASKAAAEMLVQAWGHTYGIVYTLVNMSNVFGPNQHQEKLIPMAINKILKGEEVIVHGDGSHKREWLYVDNAIEGILAASRIRATFPRYCLGGGTIAKNIDMIESIYSIIKSILPEIGGPLRLKFTNDRPTDDMGYALNSSVAKNNLGWVSGADEYYKNLRKTVDWYIHDMIRAGGDKSHGWEGQDGRPPH